MPESRVDTQDPLTWGSKRRCPYPRCRTAFYDFFATRLTCPSCSREFPVEDTLRLRPSRLARNEVDKAEDAEDDDEELTGEIDDEITDEIETVLSERDAGK